MEKGKRHNGIQSSTLQATIIVRSRNCCQTYNSFNIAQHVKSDLTIVRCIMSTNWIIPLHSHCLGLIVSHEIGSINSFAVCVCVSFVFVVSTFLFLCKQTLRVVANDDNVGGGDGGWLSTLLFYLVDFIHFALHLHLVLIIIIQLKMLHNFPFSVLFVLLK